MSEQWESLRGLVMLGGIVLIGGCAALRGAPPAPVVPACRAPAGAAELLRPGGVFLLGELHGTQQTPAAFGELVCAALASGARVEVGLELPPEELPALARYLASSGGAEDQVSLLRSAAWTREYQDGRTSAAMARLVERLRQLSRATGRVGLFTFDAYASPATREEDMARHLAAHHRAHPGAVVLVLTGNLHSRTRQGTPWNPAFVPMGLHLLQSSVPVTSIDASTSGGMAWVCSGAEASTCGAQAFGGKQESATPRLEQLPEPSVGAGVHAVLHLGPITASPPARQAGFASHE